MILYPKEGDRVLTVKQPWASLIIKGLKDVENRTWIPKGQIALGDKIWVHSSKKIDQKGIEYLQYYYAKDSQEFKLSQQGLLCGCLLGTVVVVGAGHYDSEWAIADNYQWKLAHPVEAENSQDLIVKKGQLGLWRWKTGCYKQLTLFD